MAAELPKQEHPGAVDVPTKPEPMDPSFYEALVGKSIPQGLVDYMSSENINSLEDVACYCKTDEISELLLEKHAATRGQRKFLVPLSRLWFAGKAALDIGTKRQTEGMTDVSLETPLPAEDLDALQQRHKAAYGFQLSSFSLLWPHLLGRVQKEIQSKA